MLLESYSSIFFETWFLSTKRSAFESVRGIRQTELTVQSEIGIFELTNRRSKIGVCGGAGTDVRMWHGFFGEMCNLTNRTVN